MAGAGAAGELVFVDDGAAAGEDRLGGALDLDVIPEPAASLFLFSDLQHLEHCLIIPID